MSKNNNSEIPVQQYLWMLVFIAVGSLITVSIFAFNTQWSSGTIGDTIGGSTAPFIGFLSAWLVYLSFKAQIDANKAIREESNFKYILDEFKSVKETFNSFEYNRPLGQYIAPVNYKGIAAIKELSENVFAHYQFNFLFNRQSGIIYHDSVISIGFLLKNYSVFIKEVTSLNLSEDNRRIVKSRIWLHYSEFVNEKLITISYWDVSDIQPQDIAIHHNAFRLRMEVHELIETIKQFESSLD